MTFLVGLILVSLLIGFVEGIRLNGWNHMLVLLMALPVVILVGMSQRYGPLEIAGHYALSVFVLSVAYAFSVSLTLSKSSKS